MAEPVLPAKGSRDSRIRQVESETADVVIIGGGITGAGVARSAARRGLRVVLLEAEDFAAGTSSRSTKLLHGGVRYLAMGDVGLVRHAALERKVIHGLAPHLAEPCWMLLPARSYAGWLKWRLAIGLYERLGAVNRDERHRNWSGAELEREEPLLARRFPYVTAYREYRTDDARLVLANLRSAAEAGASVLSYAPVTSLSQDGPGHAVVEARCKLTGESFRVRASVVINAAGPWVEAVRRLADDSSGEPWLHLTRGIHVTLPARRLPVRNMVMLYGRDGRLMFAMPRGPVVYIGTTDTTQPSGPQVWPEIERADVEYVLETLPRHFGVDPVDPGEVLSAWAGLRPLVAQAGKSPSEISRRDEIAVGPGRLVSIAGGKLTGYRPMAESILERAAQVMGRPLPPARPEEPLPGGAISGSLDRAADQLQECLGVCQDTAARLVRLYGSESERVVGMGREPVAPGAALLQGEIDWAIQSEGAISLEDVHYRRTRAALYDPGSEAWLEPIAARMAKLLCWTDAQRAREIEQVRRRIRADLEFQR